MTPGRARGAAVTERPVLAHAWRRCWDRAALDYVGTAGDARAVVDLDRQLGLESRSGPLVVLVDARAASPSTASVLAQVSAALLLLAPGAMSAAVRALLRSGVGGVVTVEDALDQLARAGERLAAGECYVSPAGARLLLDDYRLGAQAAAGGVDVDLTGREQAVLRAMVEGLSTKATARRLGIAVKTVEAHRGRLFSRLGVASQAEAVARALADRRLLGPRAPAPPAPARLTAGEPPLTSP